MWIKGYPFKIFPPASIFQRNPFKNFFHSIFFSGKSLVKNSKLTFNFTWKSPIKNFLHFLQGNPFTIFPKNYFWDHFSKSHYYGDFFLKWSPTSDFLKKVKGFPCKKWRKFFIGDFHVKLKVSFEFFTRDFPGKKIEWKKFLKGFLWKIEAGFTPALVLHVLYFPLKLSLIVSEEAISSRRRPPPPETRTSEARDCEVKKKWSEVKWVSEVMLFWSFKFFYFQIC